MFCCDQCHTVTIYSVTSYLHLQLVNAYIETASEGLYQKVSAQITEVRASEYGLIPSFTALPDVLKLQGYRAHTLYLKSQRNP